MRTRIQQNDACAINSSRMTHANSCLTELDMPPQVQQNDACAPKSSRMMYGHSSPAERRMRTQVQQNDACTLKSSRMTHAQSYSARITRAQFVLTTQISFRKSSYATLRFLTRNSPQGFLSFNENLLKNQRINDHLSILFILFPNNNACNTYFLLFEAKLAP